MAYEPLPLGRGSEATIERLAYVSLFTDARLDDDSLPPDGTDDRRGWWADALESPAVNTGSTLWVVLAGIPTARELEDACRAAWAWMIRVGIVSRIDVRAGIVGRRADVTADFVLESGARIPVAFPDLWSTYG